MRSRNPTGGFTPGLETGVSYQAGCPAQVSGSGMVRNPEPTASSHGFSVLRDQSAGVVRSHGSRPTDGSRAGTPVEGAQPPVRDVQPPSRGYLATTDGNRTASASHHSSVLPEHDRLARQGSDSDRSSDGHCHAGHGQRLARTSEMSVETAFRYGTCSHRHVVTWQPWTAPVRQAPAIIVPF